MDYTDGSREAKVLQELLHLIEAAMTRSHGSLQGNMPELIMKEMKKKGFNGNDFKFLQVDRDYHEQYHKALLASNIPYIGVQTVDNQQLIVVRVEDEAKLAEIDASIRKSSPKYTRTEQAESFFRAQEKLGNEVFAIPLSSPQAHEILANKAFSHEDGFVSCQADDHIYFSETAVDCPIETIFLDVALSSRENSYEGRIKYINNIHETMNADNLKEALKTGQETYFVNEYDNTANYVKAHDGILEVHTKNGLLDEVVTSIDTREYFANGREEALEHLLKKELGQVYNCEQKTPSEFEAYQRKTKGQLEAERIENLLEDAKVLSDLKDSSTPVSYSQRAGYLATDNQSLKEMLTALNNKIRNSNSPEEIAALTTIRNNISVLKDVKQAHNNLVQYANQEIKIAIMSTPNYRYLSKQEQYEFKMDVLDKILANENIKEVQEYYKHSEPTEREKFRRDFKAVFGTVTTYAAIKAAKAAAKAGPMLSNPVAGPKLTP